MCFAACLLLIEANSWTRFRSSSQFRSLVNTFEVPVGGTFVRVRNNQPLSKIREASDESALAAERSSFKPSLALGVSGAGWGSASQQR